jgi:hypothetical protein
MVGWSHRFQVWVLERSDAALRAHRQQAQVGVELRLEAAARQDAEYQPVLVGAALRPALGAWEQELRLAKQSSSSARAGG